MGKYLDSSYVTMIVECGANTVTRYGLSYLTVMGVQTQRDKLFASFTSSKH